MARRPQRLGVPPREEDRHRRRHLRSERRQERHRSQAKRTPNERVLAMLGFRVEPGLATRQHRDFELEVDTHTWQLRARITGIVGRLDVGPVPRVTVFGRGPTVGDPTFDAVVSVGGERRWALALTSPEVRPLLAEWIARGVRLHEGSLSWTWDARPDAEELRQDVVALSALVRQLAVREPRVRERLVRNLRAESVDAVAEACVRELFDDELLRHRSDLLKARSVHARIGVARRLDDVEALADLLGSLDDPGLVLEVVRSLDPHLSVAAVRRALFALDPPEDSNHNIALQGAARRALDQAPELVEHGSEAILLLVLADSAGAVDRTVAILERLGTIGTGRSLPLVVNRARGLLRWPRVREAALRAQARISSRVEVERGALSMATTSAGALSPAVQSGGLSRVDADD